MSLINNMLKDLAKRQNRPRHVPYITSHLMLKEKKFFSSNEFIILMTVICSLLLLGPLLVLTSKKEAHFKVVLPIKEHVSQLTTETSKRDNTFWLGPTHITGITLQGKGNIMEISFLLDHATLYRLISHDNNNQLSLIIDHSQLLAELPAIKAMDTTIRDMSVQTIHGDTRINLALYPGSIIKYVNLNEENSTAELIVAIQYPATVVENDSKPPTWLNLYSSIKAPAMGSQLTEKYKTALSYVDSGSYQTAITQLSALLQTDPNYKTARVSLAALLIQHGNLFKAGLVLDKGLRLNPDYIPMVELKARVLTMEGKTKAALSLMQSTMPPIDENPDYYALIAALYERSNNDSMAIRIYKQLLAINPRNGNWWFGLGVALDKSGQTNSAIEAYNRAMADVNLNSQSAANLQHRLQILQGASHDEG